MDHPNTAPIILEAAAGTLHELKDDEMESVPESQIMNVWASNLQEAMSLVADLIEDYPYIALDTEFPGVVARPRNSFKHWLGYGYRLVADNVNMLKLIQLGLTLFNEKGETPFSCGSTRFSTLQFNFRFNVERDMFAPDSVELLVRSGIDFAVLQKDGIEHAVFAEMATMSGLVLNDDVRWICFHGAYDFGYLVKTLCSRNLPNKEADFLYLLHKYFPFVYDLKVLLRNVHSIKGGGLQALATALKVERVGRNHQAGSDALLTGNVFFKLREDFFEQLMDEKKYLNTLYGLGNQQLAKQHQEWYYQ